MFSIAGDKVRYEVEGLNNEIFNKLSGSWDIRTDVNTSEYEFSWGKGKWVINHSIKIDFGAGPPQFYIGGIDLFNITSVEIIGKETYKLKVYNRWEKKHGYFIIHTDVKGAIWFERGVEFDYFYYGKKDLYYNISGPKKP